MSEITLTIPDELLSRAREHAESLHQPVERYLERRLQEMVAPASPLSVLSDREVLDMAETRMPADQDRRHVELLRARKLADLAPEDEAELWELHGLYDELQVRKARGLAEAVKRGLMPPLEL
jgi:hypothetical protein